MEWKTIQINKQNIKVETDKAVLISMPHNSKYDGFTFWHPKKLIRNGLHSNAVSLSYTDNFNFNLKRTSQKTFNVLDEKQINVIEFEEVFETMNDNIIIPKKDTESYLIIDEPEKVNKKVDIEECLKNNK